MSTLHLIRTCAYHSNELSSALQTALANDAIVLIDDGCYNLNHHLTDGSKSVLPLNFYAIDEHCQARAIANNKQIKMISMSQLVELTIEHNKVLTWQ